MFNFLKEKLKSWIGKTKDKIEEKTKPVETVKKPVKKEKVKESKPKEIKKEKIKRTKEEKEQERKVTEKVLEDIKQEKIEIKTPEEKLEQELEVKKEEPKKEEKQGFFSKLKKIFSSHTLTKDDFDEIFSDLEMSLLENNVALEVVDNIKSNLEKQLIGKEMKKGQVETEITEALKKAVEEILINPEDLIENIKSYRKISPEPYKILFFGINGAGKTTSIAKICNLLQKNKLSCILAAADTFRAASIEQLQIHADKLGVKMIKQEYGSDPSAVAFDTIKYAKQHKIDVVLVDTAGRMHTKENLIKEMEKICRVTKPNLKVFVAEAIAGNDATEQAKVFNEAIQIDGSILSKTDVDEKGGTIISISYITKKPILYLGIGQKYEDIELFDKKKFIKQLGL